MTISEMKETTGIALFSLFLSLIYGCSPSESPKASAVAEKSIPVRVTTLQRGNIRSYLELSADCEAESSALVRSRVSGQVEAVFCKEGDTVEALSPIVKLDSSKEELAVRKADSSYALALLSVKEAEAAVRAAEENLKNAQLACDHAKKEYERAEALREGGLSAISEDIVESRKYDYEQAQITAKLKEVELESSKTKLEIARARVKDAALALEEAKLNLQYRTIRAPISGQVVSFDLRVGDYVSQGQVVARIENPERLFLRFDIAQSDIAKVKPGQKVILTTQAFPGETFEGKVASVNRAADPQTGTIRARVVVEKPGKLIPGLFVVGKIVIAERKNVFVLPREAIRYEGKIPYIWYVDKDNRARRLYVKLGLEEEDMLEILSFEGAEKPPERIIKVGNVKEGDLVAIEEPEAKKIKNVGKQQKNSFL